MISSVKNIKKWRLVVVMSKKFKEIARDKLSERYEIKDVKGINPRVRTVGITEKYSDDVFINHIKYQNKYLLDDKFECTIIKFCPQRKIRVYFRQSCRRI